MAHKKLDKLSKLAGQYNALESKITVINVINVSTIIIIASKVYGTGVTSRMHIACDCIIAGPLYTPGQQH